MITNTSNIIVWEDRLTRLALALLLAATAYGIVVGASIAMYYDLTPNMGALEDNLGSGQLILYLLAVIIGLTHLPLAFSDIKHRLWKQAAIRATVFISPLIIFLGTEGVISHALGWLPISDTDRFHMLHHTVFASFPLTLSYWLGLHWWWRPISFSAVSSPSRRSWLASGVVLMWVITTLGILMGVVSPIIFGAAIIIGLVALPVIWRVAD